MKITARHDILDGPMLKHGLQAMDGVSLTLPRHRAQHPDRERVEERHEELLAAG